MDFSFKINILFKKFYKRSNGQLILVNYRCILKAANNKRNNIYRACLAIDNKIGDVDVEQNFLVSNQQSYLIILEKPYIIAIRIKTKVLNNSSHYIMVHNYDCKKLVQFFKIKANHKRH